MRSRKRSPNSIRSILLYRAIFARSRSNDSKKMMLEDSKSNKKCEHSNSDLSKSKVENESSLMESLKMTSVRMISISSSSRIQRNLYASLLHETSSMKISRNSRRKREISTRCELKSLKKRSRSLKRSKKSLSIWWMSKKSAARYLRIVSISMPQLLEMQLSSLAMRMWKQLSSHTEIHSSCSVATVSLLMYS